jgi:hypothetical protein
VIWQLNNQEVVARKSPRLRGLSERRHPRRHVQGQAIRVGLWSAFWSVAGSVMLAVALTGLLFVSANSPDAGVDLNPKLVEGLESSSIRSIVTVARNVVAVTRTFTTFV